MKRYYRITNLSAAGVGTGRLEKIQEVEFRAAVGDRQHYEAANVEQLLQKAKLTDAERALCEQAGRRGVGAVTVWCLSEDTGIAQGWTVGPAKSS